MAKKKDGKRGIEKLMIAAADLSHFAMATTTSTTLVPPSIMKPSSQFVVTSKWPNEISTIEKYNWLLHIMYGRGEYDRIQQFIRLQSYKNSYMTYVQALVYRQEGRINEALDCFQNCFRENPCLNTIKQVAKSLALLGRYRLAIDAYKEALTHTTDDWEIVHNLGLCYLNLNELREARKYFLQALQISDIQEASYLSLAKVLIQEGDREEAEAVYERGAKRNPESPELFTRIGLMAFEKANYTKAFECFGIALTFSPTHTPAIMAACQVIQKHGDADVALSKYRIVYRRKPECAQVWNNIGMCFFSKKKLVAAVSCLKRANYLAPFELYILYNLALVHLYLQQNASAAIFVQAAIRINKKFAPSYALLAVALSKLNDNENALRAFTYSLKLDPTDPMTLLNLAIFQINTGVSQSKIDTTLKQFHQYYAERASSNAQRELDTSMLDIATKLGVPPPPPPPPPISARYNEEITAPPLTLSRKLVNDNKSNLPTQPSEELLPPLKTKIYDDSRYKQIRNKHQAIPLSDTEPTQNEHTEFTF